ncbi:MAG: response regulator [Euryarchaeota archaeon]|nr:response regulator [Euryarchaeota archaeon]
MSEPGTGTDPSPQEQGEAEAPATVLVVERDPHLMKSLLLLLDRFGYQTVAVEDPIELRDVILAEHPDIILMDLDLEGYSLPGLLAAVRSEAETDIIPLVFVDGGTDLPRMASRHNAQGWLEKPFRPEELEHVLYEVLHGRPYRPSALRQAEGKVDVLFRHVWDEVSAIANTVEALRRTEGLPAEADEATADLEALLFRLEATLGRLRGQLKTVVRTSSGVEAPEVPPSPREARAEPQRGR